MWQTLLLVELAVSIRGLVKRFGDVVAVDGVDLDVRAGESFGLLGPNGAGKTTTLEIVVGLQSATAGDVEVLGRRWGGHDRELRARLGVSLQETRFPDKLTVEEVLRLFRSFHPRGRDVREVIAEVGLEDKAGTWTTKLSGGQRQRLALATALVGDPQLLVLDEPTTGLDPQARLRIGEVIRAFRGLGRAVIVSTHYLEEAQRFCDRVAIIDHGKVIALGTPAELIASLGGEVVVEIALAQGELDDAALLGLPGVRAVRHAGTAILLAVAEAHTVVPALLDLLRARSLVLANLATRQASLEDVFLLLTGRRLRDE
jgi:ABC-2 type transport system ATP-binding protein